MLCNRCNWNHNITRRKFQVPCFRDVNANSSLCRREEEGETVVHEKHSKSTILKSDQEYWISGGSKFYSVHKLKNTFPKVASLKTTPVKWL